MYALLLAVLVATGSCKDDEKPVWFVQLTDTHISYYQEPKRIEDLRSFLRTRLTKISPRVVILSGDITHGVKKNRLGDQVEAEWRAYKALLEEANLSDPKFWIDVRGNHDVFRVHGWKSGTNYYRHFSTRRQSNERFHTHVIEENNKTYVIGAIDTTLEPGLGRALNFFGLIPEHLLGELSAFVYNATKMATGGPPVFFGHHPVILVHTRGSLFKTYLSVGAYYLCGHLHTFGNMITSMYYKHSPELVELELGDWKDGRRYRIAAWDQGRFSFVDVLHRDEVAVLVTYPKLPGLSIRREQSIPPTQEIRMLIFSFGSPISNVEVGDNHMIKNATRPVVSKYPLWTVPWDFEQNRQSTVKISVQLADGSTHHKLHRICVGCDEQTYGLGAKLALDFVNINKVYVAYCFLLGVHIATLVFFRLYVPPIPDVQLRSWRQAWFKCVMAMNRLCSLSFCFFGLLLVDLYSLFGPWVIGELTDAQFGLSFLWGTVLGNDRLPSDVLVVFATVQLLIIQYPALVALAALLSWRLDNNGAPFKATTGKYQCVFSNLTMLYATVGSFLIAAANFFSFPYFFLLSWLTVFNPWLMTALWMYVLLTPLLRIKRSIRSHGNPKVS